MGLAHNFAASTQDLASVMDYPHPLVTIDANGEIGVADAYDEGIGDWVKRAILWGYQDFPPNADSDAGRAVIMADTLAARFEFVADEHARGSQRSEAGPAHPLGSLWNNGSDPVAELNRVMAVRAAALAGFSERVIQVGEPMAHLEDLLVPIYLMHRYQVQAAATKLGGQHFTYAMRGDGQRSSQPVAAAAQRTALVGMLDTLSPETLMLPTELVLSIPPRPPQSRVSRELSPRETGYVFDPAVAAAAAAQLNVGELLDPRRAARLNNQRMVTDTLPDCLEVLREGRAHIWAAQSKGVLGIMERRVQLIWVNELGALINNENAAAQVRADAMLSLTEIARDAQKQVRSRDSGWRAHGLLIERLILGVMASDRPLQVAPVRVPPGSPI